MRRQNIAALDDRVELAGFLFGGERESLSVFRDVLRDQQRGACFYCLAPLKGEAEVDHFIPWALYPRDLGHNFVLAHGQCNNQKSDRLAAVQHLERWSSRNEEHGRTLGAVFDERGIVHDLAASTRIASWAYRQTESTGGLVWCSGRDGLVALDSGWRSLPGLAA